MSNYKYTFFDNQLIGVDHLNEITKRLVSGGISAVYSGADFNVSDINDANKAILTGGVVPESDLNLKVTSLGGGKYLINAGLCFFGDGTTMEVLAGGEEFLVTPGLKKHVYLTSDQNKMMCYVEISESEKQSGEYVYLAVINADGTITDKRSYARGKLPGYYASTEGMEVNITETYYNGDIVADTDLEVAVGEGSFKHLLMKFEVTGDGVHSIYYCEFENGKAVNQVGINIDDSEATTGSSGFRIYSEYYAGRAFILGSIKLENGKLIIPISDIGYINEGSVKISYHLW